MSFLQGLAASPIGNLPGLFATAAQMRQRREALAKNEQDEQQRLQMQSDMAAAHSSGAGLPGMIDVAIKYGNYSLANDLMARQQASKTYGLQERDANAKAAERRRQAQLRAAYGGAGGDLRRLIGVAESHGDLNAAEKYRRLLQSRERLDSDLLTSRQNREIAAGKYNTANAKAMQQQTAANFLANLSGYESARLPPPAPPAPPAPAAPAAIPAGAVPGAPASVPPAAPGSRDVMSRAPGGDDPAAVQRAAVERQRWIAGARGAGRDWRAVQNRIAPAQVSADALMAQRPPPAAPPAVQADALMNPRITPPDPPALMQRRPAEPPRRRIVSHDFEARTNEFVRSNSKPLQRMLGLEPHRIPVGVDFGMINGVPHMTPLIYNTKTGSTGPATVGASAEPNDRVTAIPVHEFRNYLRHMAGMPEAKVEPLRLAGQSRHVMTPEGIMLPGRQRTAEEVGSMANKLVGASTDIADPSKRQRMVGILTSYGLQAQRYNQDPGRVIANALAIMANPANPIAQQMFEGDFESQRQAEQILFNQLVGSR